MYILDGAGNRVVSQLYLTSDPSAGGGVAAPIGSQAEVLISGVGSLWVKSGAADTAWTQLKSGTLTNIATGTGLTGGPITSTGTISLADTAVTPAAYTLANITVDQQGRITAAASGSAVTSVATGTGLTGGPITSTGTVALANTAVTPATYNFMTAAVDQQGRITSASTGVPVTSVATGTGLSGGTITSTGTISLANTAVTPGAYTSANITIDQQGRITAAASGTGAQATATKTANYSMTTTDRIIFCDTSGGAFNLTLPAPASMTGVILRIIDSTGNFNTNNLTLVRNASEKIAGLAASRVLQANWGFYTVTSNGTDWFLG